ncbi:TonB-dependent receptor [Aquimarina sediminis]|uniref:TonB-dependent receptor n=1 Tax=Aquimarina sediminis TaxID=2070536 RepID=UPI000CA00AFD|nr:TonB-dependent receptor [Aquimarina sediminis]
MKRHTWFLVFLLGISFLSAQECDNTLSGRIIDFHDGVPLEGARITFNNRTIVADATGTYHINGLCPTTYAFTISHEKCNSKVVTLDMAKVSSKDFYLEHHLNELEEVKVNGANKTKTTSAQEETIGSDILEKYSSASLGDALKNITGVSSLNTGSTIVKPIIQGLSGSRVLIMNNGVRMQDMEWGDEHAPNIDINTAGNVTVVKGASALKYGGDAIGGVVIMEPNKVPAKDTLYGKTVVSGAVNGRGGSVSSELIKGYENGWFLKAQGTIKRFGDVEAPDYVLSNTGVFEKGASLSFGVNKFTHGWDAYYSFFNNEIGVLATSHIGNVDDLISAINSQQPAIIRDFTYKINNPRQEVTHHLGRLRYFKRFEELGKWNTQYDFQYNQRFEYDIRRTEERSKIPSIDLELKTHTLTSDFTFDSNSEFLWNIGGVVRYQNNFADPSTGVRRLIPDYDKYDAGVFITGEYDLTNNIILDGGVRYDYNRMDAQKFYSKSRWTERGYNVDFSDFITGDFNSEWLTNPVFDYHSISGTIGAQYTYKEDYEFRFNYAMAQRAPNPSELFSDGLHHSAARIELGDLRIDQETSHKVSINLQKNTDKWGWEIAPYANFINDYILLEPVDVQLSIRGAFPVWDYRQTDVRLLGVDAKVYANWHQDWRTDHNFSLVKGKENKSDTPLINIPAPNFNNSVTYKKEDWFGLNISVESQYFFEQNEYPPNLTVFSPQQQENVLLEINTPPAAYHLLNTDTSMEFSLGEKNKLKVGLTINNILNKSYRNYLNRQRYFADDLGRNFLLRLSINY